MRRPLLLRSFVLGGAALSLVTLGSGACATVVGGDPVDIRARAGTAITQETIVDQAPAPAARSAALHETQAGPSVFEQQARQGQPGKHIAAGPSTFEQQLRSQAPSPPPSQITRGPGPHWP